MSRTCELTGKSVMTGNNVSKANNRTRRRFLPNLQKCSMYSQALGKSIQLRLATSSIRTVEKNGGLDAFLLSSKKSRLPIKAKNLLNQILKTKENTAV